MCALCPYLEYKTPYFPWAQRQSYAEEPGTTLGAARDLVFLGAVQKCFADAAGLYSTAMQQAYA